MPRSSKSGSPRWTMPSFFSSGFSSRRAPTTAEKEDSRSIKTENSPAPAKEKATPPVQEEAGPWVLLYDCDGRHFLWNKNTGQWTYDAIAIYAPPPQAVDAMGYSYYGPYQQRHYQQQQQRPFSYVQPSGGHYASGPYAAVHHHPWHTPPPMATPVPRMIPAAPSVVPIFF